MKKAGRQVLAMLLAVVMVLSSATAVFADEAAPETSEPVAETGLTEESEAAPLNAEAAPQESEPEAAEDPEAAELSEYLESLPLNTAAPEPYAMDNSTTLADGEYPVDAANFSFTGGTGKARLTLSKVVVTGGRAYGHFAASSSNMTHAFIGTSNTSEETAAIYDPATDTLAENVYKIENKAVVMPVDLNVEVPVACRTTAMTDPHWIQYRYVITLAEPEAPAKLYNFTMQLSKAPKNVSDTHPANYIEGEWIKITDVAGTEYPVERISDAGSMYSVRNLPASTYTITAGVPGYEACNNASNDVWDTPQHGYIFTPTGTDEHTYQLVIDESKEDQGNIILTFVKKQVAVDFSRVDELLAMVPENTNLFVADTVAPVTAAVAAINRGETDQTVIDGWAEALEAALAGLLPKDGRYEVSLTKFNGTPYYLYEGLSDSDKNTGKTVLVVKDGKMTAENVLKNQSYAQAYLGTKEDAIAAATETELPAGCFEVTMGTENITINGKSFKYSAVTVDVPSLCKKINYAYHSSNTKYAPNAGWYDHAVIYQANSLVRLDTPAEEYPVELAITNNTGMFKAVTASVEKDGEQLYLVMALSGTGYHELFAGTYEQAVANGDNRDNWVHGALNADGRWEFRFPITAETTYVPCVAISQSYLTKYDNGQGTLERAFYPRQFELNLEEKTLVTGDYDETMDVAVTSNMENFKVAETAKMRVVGGPNSNNYNCAPTLQMLDGRYDSVTYPTVVGGKLSTATAALSEDLTFAISLLNAPNLAAFKDKEPVEMVFHVAGTEESETIPVTIDKMARTIEIGEKPAPQELTDGTYKATKIATDVTTDRSGMIMVTEATVVIKDGQATAIVTMKGKGADRFYVSDTATKDTIISEAVAEEQKELSGQECGLLGGLVLEGSSAYTFWPVPIELGVPKVYAARSASHFKKQDLAPEKYYYVHDFKIDKANLEKISDSTEIMTPEQDAQRYIDQYFLDGKISTAATCKDITGSGANVTVPYYRADGEVLKSFVFKMADKSKFRSGWFVEPGILNTKNFTSSNLKKIRYPEGSNGTVTCALKAAVHDEEDFVFTATLKLYDAEASYNQYDGTGVYYDKPVLAEQTFTITVAKKPVINFNTTVAAKDAKSGEAIEGITVRVFDEADNSEIAAVDGVYPLNSLKKYTLAVSKEGYVAVGGAGEARRTGYSPLKDETVTLELLKEEESRQTVTFDVKDQFDEAVTNPAVMVRLDGEPVAPEEDGSYRLLYNTRYTYTVEAEGYQAYTYGSITPKQDTVEKVKLNKYLTEHKIFLDAKDSDSHEAIENVEITVVLGEEELAPGEDGGYTAPDGEDVEVTCYFRASGYKPLSFIVKSTGFDAEIRQTAWMYKTEEVLLDEEIEAAREFSGSIVEGEAELEYPEGTKDALDEAIEAAQDVYDDDYAGEDGYSAARKALKKAVNAAKAAQNPRIATITVRINTAFNEVPQVLENLKVTGDDGKQFGYKKSSAEAKNVTFVDVIAAVHKELYGEEFVKSPKNYYEQEEMGLWVITKMFGSEIKNAAYELALNNVGVDHLGYYKKVVEDGDVVSIGVAVGKGDYLYFESDDVKTLPGEYTTYLFKDRKNSLDPEDRPAEGYEVTLVKEEAASGNGLNGEGEPVEVKGTSDADGKITFTFEQPGVYTVKSVTKEGVENICVPNLKVTVKEVYDLAVTNNFDLLDVVGAKLDVTEGTLTIEFADGTTFSQAYMGEAAESIYDEMQDIGEDKTFTFPVSYFEENGGAADINFASYNPYANINCLVTLDSDAKTLKLDPDDADYSAVEEAMQKVYALTPASYTEDSLQAVYSAAGKVVTGLNKSHQDRVDAMADELNSALKALVLKKAVTDRYEGKNRYKTSLAIAEQLKKQLGVKKFDTVVLCTGENYPDALAGGYLAQVKNAPLLLIRGKAADKTNVTKYINNNLNKNGTVYVLGSTKAVPKSWISGLKSSFKVKRLAGSNRFGTNNAILKEAGLSEHMSVIVTSGYDYTDALCASAISCPLLIVNTKKNILTKEQKDYLKSFNGTLFFTVVGPSSVISDKIFNALKEFGSPMRIATDKDPVNRSVQIAQYYMPRPQTVTLATSGDFADGLSGGILASRSLGPLLLVKSGKEAKAKAFVKEAGVREGLVLGSTKAVSDKSVKKILPDAKKIKIHDYKY